MENTSDRALAYQLATPIQEADLDQVSGGAHGTVGKWPKVIITGTVDSPDFIIES